MPKKLNFLDFRNPTLWLSCFAIFSILAGGILKWGNIPERVEAVEKQASEIGDWIKEQQIANRYYLEKEKEKKTIIYTPDGKMFFDHELNKWRPVKELENR